jgi:DNA polymerase (family 10)
MHSILDFNNLQYGIGQARRGWIEHQHVLNTLSAAQVKKFCHSTRMH